MRRFVLFCIFLLFAAIAFAVDPAGSKQQVDAIYPDLDKLYIDLHQNPELAFQEKQTSAKLAERLKAMGYRSGIGNPDSGIEAGSSAARAGS